LKLSLKRLTAYWLDFMLLAIVLLSFQYLLSKITAGFPFDYLKEGFSIEIWVLLTMSLPVWLYFICCELYKQQTIGKRILSLKVVSVEGSKLTLRQALLRTLIKLLPWEITHIIVLIPEPWYNLSELPDHMFLIYVPNAMILLYILVLFVNKGKRGIHDYIAKTMVKG